MIDEQPQEERIFSPLAERMRSDYFTVAENFKEAWTLMKSRFSYYVFLALLVYLPIQIVLQYQVSLLDLTVEAPELLMSQMAKLGIAAGDDAAGGSGHPGDRRDLRAVDR